MLGPGFKAATVTELVAHVKTTLEDTFHEVMVEGEVTNLSSAHSGHWYFTLSDAESAISCALFKGEALRNPLIRQIKEGDKILVYGPLTVFQKRGTFQILAKRIMPAGEGAARLKLEALKKKLQAEGLFDLDRKRALATFPKRVAVITAPQGAALQDFLNVYRRRALHWEIVVVPALMQGEKAPASILSALDLVERRGDFDVVVFTRGGGSSEDLGAFNDERLVRRIANCPMPTISAVGHQVDWTLCDHVADVRCETPTAAAETLTQPQTELLRRLSQAQRRLASALMAHQNKLRLLLQRYHPQQMLARLQSQLQEHTFRLDDLEQRLSWRAEEQVRSLRHRLEKAHAQLKGLGPQSVLARGYSYITTSADQVVSSVKDWENIAAGDRLRVHWHDGVGEVIRPAKESV